MPDSMDAAEVRAISASVLLTGTPRHEHPIVGNVIAREEPQIVRHIARDYECREKPDSWEDEEQDCCRRIEKRQ